MNHYKQQLLELSTELYQRAADKAKKYQRGAKRMSKWHTEKARAKGRENPGMNAPKVLPHISLSLKYDDLGKERKQQVGKFSAAAKGVKTTRPGRGYTLGAYQKNLVKQTQIQLNREKMEEHFQGVLMNALVLEASKKEEEGEAHAEAEMLANVNRTFRAQQKLKTAGWPPHETTEAEYDQEERSTQRAMRRANARGVGTGSPATRGIYAQRAQLNKLKKGSKAYDQPKPTAYRRKRDMEGGWPPTGDEKSS